MSGVPSHRRRLRRAIIAQLGQQAMDLHELAGELEHFASTSQVRRELLALVNEDVICSRFTGGSSLDVYETWERAVARVRGREGSGRRARAHGREGARAVA